jgi:hypothetical protein
MKTIILTNENGETIRVRKTPTSQVEISHSDIDPNAWGEFWDAGLSHQGKEALGKVKIGGQTCLLSNTEMAMIRAAVKELD